jgi:hypothetical protein
VSAVTDAAERPSTLYRRAVQQMLFRWSPPAGTDPEVALRRHLETQHAQDAQALKDAVARGASSDEITALKNGLFVYAVGLFAFGRANLAEEILDNMPSTGDVRRLALALVALLPLPGGVDPLRDPEAVRTWLRAQLEGVRWDETIGRYVLKGELPV